MRERANLDDWFLQASKVVFEAPCCVEGGESGVVRLRGIHLPVEQFPCRRSLSSSHILPWPPGACLENGVDERHGVASLGSP